MILSPLERASFLSKTPEQFYDEVRNPNYPIQPEHIATLIEGTSNFAKGFINSVYGDVAIPVVLAGASGLLGDTIKQNIHWAANEIVIDVWNNKELAAKIIALYLYHHKAMIVGKFASTLFMVNRSLRLAGVTARGGHFMAKSMLNEASLIIITLTSHKAYVQSLSLTGKIAVIAYVAATGDTNLTNFNKSSSLGIELFRKANKMRTDPPSLEEMNNEYKQAKELIDSLGYISSNIRNEAARND